MTVRRNLTFIAALLVALLGSACSDREREPTAAETDEPLFVQARQLQRQGRNPEALTLYLKVIERRGARASAESHFEAGQIFLNHTKDPVEAYHHFRKYLELQPNSRQAELVRGMAKVALREFAKTIPGRPMDDQSMRLQADDELARLRRENDELRAELAVSRGGGMTPLNRTARMIPLPVESRVSVVPVPTAPIVESPVTSVPRRPIVPNSNPVRPAPVAAGPKPPVANARPAASRPTAVPGGRTHTVVAKDTLFSLAKRYGVRMEDLAAANGLPSVSSPLRLGATLKIPATP